MTKEKQDEYRDKVADKFSEVKSLMVERGTYKPEFDDAISEYAKIQVELDVLQQRYINSGMPSQVSSGGGYKRSPIVAQLNELRKQLVSYSDRLGLTPKALSGLKQDDKKEHDDAIISLIKQFNDSRRDDNLRETND